MVPTSSTLPPLAEIRRIVGDVCARHPVARADLFGSVARGENGPGSDIDVLVEFVPEVAVGLLELGALREELADALACPVDVVSRRAVERSANPFRRRALLGTTVTAYVR
jgi:predicted nucleotidyltransferase